ncbi:MAG TPA: hypothetical protein VFH13_06715 [Gemmatimonadaceae bacterium]|nr:hypothetical protein [Gemmatimonadaceae bacterium]
MKRLIMIVAVACVAASATGCGRRPPEIELTANDFDLNPLVGEWRGNYSNPAAGRRGTIAFTLRAGESSASGNVIMIPGKPDSVTSAAAMARSVLKINFIRKEGRKVTGTLDPYRDPACGCRVITTFEVTFTDSRTIEGTFATVPSETGFTATGGRWKVERVRRL